VSAWQSGCASRSITTNPDVAYLYENAGSRPSRSGVVRSQENLLYFIEKLAPKLAPWQRELVRIVRKISQYFYRSG